MVNKFKRYLHLFLILARINLLQTLEYRVNFFTGILPTGTYSAAYIIFMGSVLQRFPSVAGWNFDQMLMLFVIEQFIFYSGWLLYRRSLDNFSELIRNGTFDFVAKMPVNTRFLMSFRQQSPDIILPSLGSFAILIYAARNIPFTFINFLLFIFFVITGIFILYNIFFILASLSFWTTESDEYIALVDEIRDFGRYPLNIYPQTIGFLLMTILPVLLVIYVPATSLIGILDWKMALLNLFILYVTFFISEKVWQSGRRHYSSASS